MKVSKTAESEVEFDATIHPACTSRNSVFIDVGKHVFQVFEAVDGIRIVPEPNLGGPAELVAIPIMHHDRVGLHLKTR